MGRSIPSPAGARYVVPASPPDLVVRRRLLDAVARGVRGPLTLVTAPAGAGKTVLLSSWAALGEAPGPVTWLTMRPGDELPGAFWPFVVGGFRSCGLQVPAEPVAEVGRSFLAVLAWHLVDSEEPVVLVLDAADRSLPKDLARQLAYVIRRSGDMLRVVLLSRKDPPLLRDPVLLTAVATELRAEELALTRREASVLLERSGVRLPAGELRALLASTSTLPQEVRAAAGRRAEGWPPVPPGSARLLVEPLTGKEREVLGHLAALLTTFEIAASMLVTVNTVRTHVRNLLRKLGVSRRSDAVRRAWQLGMLPAPGVAIPWQRPAPPTTSAAKATENDAPPPPPMPIG